MNYLQHVDSAMHEYMINVALEITLGESGVCLSAVPLRTSYQY